MLIRCIRDSAIAEKFEKYIALRHYNGPEGVVAYRNASSGFISWYDDYYVATRL